MTPSGSRQDRPGAAAAAAQGRLKAAYSAATEVEAVMLQGVLEDAGIPVLLRSHLIPGYGLPYPEQWGDLLVPEERAADARRLIEQYLASLSPETP